MKLRLIAAAAALTFPFSEAYASALVTVVYSGPVVEYGPISFGLSGLPNTVTSQFVLNDEALERLALDTVVTFGLSDLELSSANFGPATWSALDSFSMTLTRDIDTGAIGFDALTYSFHPIDTLGVASGIVVNNNFQLYASGTDIASGQAFSYFYGTSEQSFSYDAFAVPEPSAWALMLLGFGGISFSMRRQRRQEALKRA